MAAAAGTTRGRPVGGCHDVTTQTREVRDLPAQRADRIGYLVRDPREPARGRADHQRVAGLAVKVNEVTGEAAGASCPSSTCGSDGDDRREHRLLGPRRLPRKALGEVMSSAVMLFVSFVVLDVFPFEPSRVRLPVDAAGAGPSCVIAIAGSGISMIVNLDRLIRGPRATAAAPDPEGDHGRRAVGERSVNSSRSGGVRRDPRRASVEAWDGACSTPCRTPRGTSSPTTRGVLRRGKCRAGPDGRRARGIRDGRRPHGAGRAHARGELQIRGMAARRRGQLWVYVHAVGPGPPTRVPPRPLGDECSWSCGARSTRQQPPRASLLRTASPASGGGNRLHCYGIRATGRARIAPCRAGPAHHSSSRTS